MGSHSSAIAYLSFSTTSWTLAMQSMTWKQFAAGASRKGVKKGFHTIYLCSDDDPSAEVIVFEGYVCDLSVRC